MTAQPTILVSSFGSTPRPSGINFRGTIPWISKNTFRMTYTAGLTKCNTQKASCDVWMMTKSVVSVAAIVGSKIRDFGCILRVQQYMRFPHIAKVDLVQQRVVHPRPVVVQA
ncbi:hypothetical protein TNCV_4954781 [Trichonephila clavipes]|nr:hypothetical protein TNCV_4954781 [Trichonephila clavipes]